MWLDDWVASLVAKSRHTVAAYLSDVELIAEALCDVCGKERPGLLDDPVALELAASDPAVKARAARYGFVARSYVKAAELFSVLELADLAPKLLARALAYFEASPGPVRRPTRAYTANRTRRAGLSVRRARASWSSFCLYLVGQDVLASNPVQARAVPKPRAPEPSVEPLSVAEVQRLLMATTGPLPGAKASWPARDAAVLGLYLATGVRLGEGTGATVGAFIDDDQAGRHEGAHLRVIGKGGKVRNVPVHYEAAESLARYLNERAGRIGPYRPGDPLLVRTNGQAFSPAAMRRLVDSLFRAGAIDVETRPGALVHVLRHTFASLALDAGASLTEVRDLLGHANIATTQRYLKTMGHGLRQAVDTHPTRAALRQLAGASSAGAVADDPGPARGTSP